MFDKNPQHETLNNKPAAFVNFPFFRIILASLLLAVFTLFSAPQTFAQDGVAQITIIDTDVSRIPTVELEITAFDENGTPINFDNQIISVKHNDLRADNVIPLGTRSTGTFTAFLLDLTPGTEGEVQGVKNVIEQFISPSFMQENVDTVTIQRVDEVSALELVPATKFYNEIRNRLADDIEVQSGPTALLNSLGELINRLESLRGDVATPTSIIVFSDGTDSISTQYSADQIPELAKSKNIIINTVWIENQNLSFSVEAGQNYMQTLAAATGGTYSVLSDSANLNQILATSVASTGSLRLAYDIPNVEAGTFDIEVSLPDLPAVAPGRGLVTVPAGIPALTFNVPVEERTVTLADLSQPVELSFPLSLRWLDDQDRGVENAQFFVNNNLVAEIPPDQIYRFSTMVQLNDGLNEVKVAMTDGEQNLATAQMFINAIQGEADEVPASLTPPGNILRMILLGLAILVLLAVITILGRILWRRIKEARADGRLEIGRKETPPKSKPSPRIRQEPRVQQTRVSEPVHQQPTPVAVPAGTPYIEVLDALTRVAARNPIGRSEFLMGRSPTVDLSFAEDPTVSRIHATIVRDGDIFRIYDEQSTSGTYVNDREVPDYGIQLTDGDELHLGAVHLRFRSG